MFSTIFSARLARLSVDFICFLLLILRSFLFLLLHKNVTCKKKKQGIQVRVLFYSPFLVIWLFLLAYFAFSICASCVFVIDGIAVKQVLQQPDRKKKTALHIALHFISSHHNLARQLNSSTLYCPTLQNCLKTFETSCGVAIAVLQLVQHVVPLVSLVIRHRFSFGFSCVPFYIGKVHWSSSGSAD